MALEDLSLHDSNFEDVEDIPFIPRVRAKVSRLEDLDIEHELLANYNDAQDILGNLNPNVTPTNQQAQAMNSLNAILKDIINMRTSLFNAERIKKIEASLIYALKKHPDLYETFMVEYERVLKQ